MIQNKITNLLSIIRRIFRALIARPSLGVRLVTRVIFYPIILLPQCELKDRARRFVLNFQHSLPIELAANKGDIVVQVGTPRPRTMRRFHKAVGKQGRVIIIEAELKNYERLGSAKVSMGYENVDIVNTAAWSENMQGKLTLSESYSGDHKISIDGVLVDNDLRIGNEETKEIPCDFRKLDDILNELSVPSIDYLSITVNGAELEVLKGAREVLRRSLDTKNTRIYVKGHSLLDDGCPLNVEIEKFFHEIGYKTKITKGELSTAADSAWNYRAGDVYAWHSNR